MRSTSYRLFGWGVLSASIFLGIQGDDTTLRQVHGAIALLIFIVASGIAEYVSRNPQP